MEGLDYTTLIPIVLIGACFALAVVVNFKVAFLTVLGLLLASSLAAPVDWQGHPVATWMTPVQARRSEIVALCGGLLALTVVFHFHRIKVGQISMQGLCLLVIGVYAGFVRIMSGVDIKGGFLTMIFAALTILPAILVIRSLVNSKDDALNLLRVIAMVSAAWIGMCAVQFLVRAKVLALGGGYTRFNGMLSNPQHAAAFLAPCATVCLFLLLNDTKLKFKPLWAALTAVNAVFVLWTGSRTGLGMLSIGFAAVLYTRLGRAVLLVPIAGAFFLMIFDFVSDTFDIGIERFTGGEDTRSRAWAYLIDQFYDNPLFGSGSAEETRFSENSYLFGLATYGVFMGIILVVFTLVSIIVSLRLVVLRRKLDALEKRLTDLCIGYFAMYFAGAMFEGYMLSRVSSSMVFMAIFGSLGAWLAYRASTKSEDEIAQEDSGDHGWDFEEAAEYADYGSDTGSRAALHDSSAH